MPLPTEYTKIELIALQNLNKKPGMQSSSILFQHLHKGSNGFEIFGFQLFQINVGSIPQLGQFRVN